MKKKLGINKILFLNVFLMSMGQTIYAQYVPPVMDGYTHYNKDYYDKMVAESKPTQESPWGFQELYVADSVVHNVSSINDYLTIYSNNTFNGEWTDGKTHIVYFASGEYNIPYTDSYYIMKVPSKTIIQGAGMGETIFKAINELSGTNQAKLFALANSEDLVIRDMSFYNETKDNKWGLIRGTDWHSATRENFLFENIEFDDAFGALGVGGADDVCNYNFITLRGLRKRIGNTTARIKSNYTTPVPDTYQFPGSNDKHVKLAGQIGVRGGNSVVIHDCIVGDNISATIDIYNNYIEMVGISFVNPLHDHSVKCPNGNHLYLHDCTFNLTYAQSIMQDGGSWNPTFFTHEGGQLANYHFKNLEFTRAHQVNTAINHKGTTITYRESEPFMLYNNRPENASGDMVWENISFNGYSSEHQVVGYPNVQADKGFKAINYSSFTAKSAQMKQNNNNSRGAFTVTVDTRAGNSKTDITGVYSWGQKADGSIDFPRDNRTFDGTKSEMENKPYVEMQFSTVKAIYNARLIATSIADITGNANSLSVYPNPVEGIMNVESATGIRSISVTNILGQEVLNTEVSYKRIAKINTSELKSGVYVIRVVDKNGDVSTQKIIKK